MDKMHYPRGLIRYSTPNGMAQKLSTQQMIRRVLRPRVLIYSAVLIGISMAVLGSLVMRDPFRVDVVRDRGALARIVGQGQVENVYRLQIMNATEVKQQYQLRVMGITGASVVSESLVEVDAASSRWVPVRVQAPPDAATSGSHPMTFLITAQPSGAEVAEKSVFLVPR
jgi:polyferredoxin